jgi:membrane protein required for colicin V production
VNWVDFIVVAVLVISALLAFLRGFVREVLGVGAWVGAALFAANTVDLVRDRFHQWLGGAEFGDPAAWIAMFLLALIVLSIITGMLARLVRASGLGGIDRTVGVAYGLARGGALLVVAYLVGGFLLPPDRWPPPVQQAVSLPYIYEGAEWVAHLLPEQYRPPVKAPPAGAMPTAAELFQSNPQGRAVGQP